MKKWSMQLLECMKRDVFRMAIAPEGTRKKVDDWKTGFYYIAEKAEVPILPIAFDWENRMMVFHPLFTPTGNKEKDFTFLKSIFKGVVGKVPEYS